MKINKLLLFLLALVSLNSCVEYVDNGTQPDGPEKPEEQVFVAKLSEESEGEFVGDEFIFEATLNGVDVTSSTTFKVNGVAAKGNVYKAIKEGENAVLATMDDFTSTFRFTVKEKDEEEPEPTGNRIEYDGESYPVSETQWGINVNASNQILKYTLSGSDYTLWVMVTGEYDNNGDPVNEFLTAVYVPMINPTTVAFPNEAPSAIIDANIGGGVTINGSKVFDITNSTYVFAGTGNTVPQNWMAQQPAWLGTANYTSTATGESSSNTAQLFWNGNYEAIPVKLGAKSAKTVNINNLKDLNFKKLKSLNETQIKNLKIAK